MSVEAGLRVPQFVPAPTSQCIPIKSSPQLHTPPPPPQCHAPLLNTPSAPLRRPKVYYAPLMSHPTFEHARVDSGFEDDSIAEGGPKDRPAGDNRV
ncbi:hypothetical protein M427DRAFT_51766 [Gonapodya prolifera JEL478]|uniref:Uncharacterized protein n=1 Tax=Gonapodya prolifera (strain JEL478) TaxID=1344416 RepID=A0A139AVP5_GONPJ|nr:hypothetical protein M427DRAFT_51766 [Gonapodya prolifera JEL478]|eukprot:KXS20808.1 hypothetical protein M427DRAFT_51766 [Gonapodya prolifera JEL478]